MMTQLNQAILALSRRIQFKGKGRLLDLLGNGSGRRDVVPDGVDSAECIDGIRVESSCPQDVMFRELYVHGLYQDDVLTALRHLLRDGDVFWDIGANYGFMSIYVDRHFEGRVRTIAFEPSPIVLPELRRNLEVNGCRSVTVEQICLSDTIGSVPFYTSPDHSWNATLIKAFAHTTGEEIQIDVPSTTLDECVERMPPPSVIKLDVEGAEHLVIRGGRRYLSRHRVPIVAEYNVESIRDVALSPEQYLGLYEELGYSAHWIERPLWGRYRWKGLRRVTHVHQLPGLCNLVLLPAQ